MKVSDADLDFLDNRGAVPELREGEPWRVVDLESADWALQRLGECEAEHQEIEEQYIKAVARLAARRMAMLDRVDRGIAFFRAVLSQFAESASGKKSLLKGGAKKSRELMHGRIGWRTRGSGYSVADEEQLVRWALNRPLEEGLLDVTPRLSRSGLKKWLASHPTETPPGVAVEDKIEELFITTNTLELE